MIQKLIDFLKTLLPKSIQSTTPTNPISEILSNRGYKTLMLDRTYNTYSLDTLNEGLIENSISEEKYRKEVRDCDDFAFATFAAIRAKHLGIPFGVVIGTTVEGTSHAWNIFIDTDDEIWFIEPQNDKIFQPTTEKIRLIII